MVKAMKWLLPAAALGALIVGLSVAGCTGGTPVGVSGSARAAVESWKGAVEKRDTTSYDRLFSTTYAYDGAAQSAAGAPTPGGASSRVPNLGFMGAQGQTTATVIDVTETGDTAVSHMEVTFTGFLSDFTNGPTGGGQGGGGTTKPAFTSPGQTPPSPPPMPDPSEMPATGGTTQPGTGGAVAVLNRAGVTAKQFTTTPLSFTALYELRLEKSNGLWMVVGQRQVQSSLLVGNGAQAPAIENLAVAAAGSAAARADTPQFPPKATIQVSGNVRRTTSQSVSVRVGYIAGELPVTSQAFSGDIRGPRTPGLYCLEVAAVNENAESGTYGEATASLEIEVISSPDSGFSFTVGPGVTLPSGMDATLRDIATALYQQQIDRVSRYVSPDYSYNGGDPASVIWQIPIPYYYESDLSVQVAQATSVGGREVVDLSFRQVADDLWGPVAGGGTSGGGSSGGGQGSSGGAVTPPPYLKAMVAARQMTTPPMANRTLTVTGTVRLEFVGSGGNWLITAIRPLDVATVEGNSPAIAWDGAVTANGSDSPAVVGGTTLAVAGAISGSANSVWVSTNEGSASQDSVSGPFQMTVAAPFTAGRWLATASAMAWNEAGSSTISRTVEVTVTRDAPTPEFTAAPGVDLPSTVRPTLDLWMGGLYFGSVGKRTQAYSPSYAYDGRSASDMVNNPRLYGYHADVRKALVTNVGPVRSDTAVTFDLEFLGTQQWFGDGRVYMGPGQGTVPPARTMAADGTSPQPVTGQALTRLTMTLLIGSDGLIVGERIDNGYSGPEGQSLSVGNLLVNGQATATVAAGSQVSLAATISGDSPFDPTARLGDAYAPAPGGNAVVAAPANPGLYLAEIVAGAASGPVPMAGAPDSSIMPPQYTGATAIAGVEVTVQ